jgi:hypothetical protein
MPQKKPKCTPATARHRWLHMSNYTSQRTLESGQVELKLRGRYKCIVCRAYQSGDPVLNHAAPAA